jgi:hypothetical protein
MKKILLITAMIFASLATIKSMAQVSVGVSINIGSQPVWGPVGYDHVDYYYMPDIDVYYNVPQHQYVYLSNGRWIFAASLPARYSSYDVYRGYKVVINEPRPYLHADVYRTRYAKYKGNYGHQAVIRDSRDPKYYVIEDHPMHGHWKGDDHGHREGHGDDHDNGHHH